MEIGVRVEKEDPYTGAVVQTNSAYLTFVALNDKSKPVEVPRLRLENDEDLRRHTEARIRVKVRNRMKAAMKRKLGKISDIHASGVTSEIPSGQRARTVNPSGFDFQKAMNAAYQYCCEQWPVVKSEGLLKLNLQLVRTIRQKSGFGRKMG